MDGNLYYTELSGQQACFFGSPSNHYKGDYDLFPVGDKIGYSVKERGYATVLYNKRDWAFRVSTKWLWNSSLATVRICLNAGGGSLSLGNRNTSM